MLSWVLVLTMAFAVNNVRAKSYYLGKCPKPLDIMEDFDTIKFLGRWFEVERTFALFEAMLRCVSVEYFLREDGKLGIRNSGVNALGHEQTITGKAFAEDPLHSARLTVTLQGVIFPANLTVLHTDYENFAVLWSCKDILGGILGHTENMWILSRKPYLDENLKHVLYQFLVQTGVGLKGLKQVEQTHCPHRAVKIQEETQEYIAYKPDSEQEYHHSVGGPSPHDQHDHHQHTPQHDQHQHIPQHDQHNPQHDQHQHIPQHDQHQHTPQHDQHQYSPQHDQHQHTPQHDQHIPHHEYGAGYADPQPSPNYGAPVQVGQTYKPGSAPYGKQGNPVVQPAPHYHDDGQSGIAYQKPNSNKDYDYEQSNRGKVHFKEEYPNPREVDPQDNYKQETVDEHDEEPRTYRDRKGLRAPDDSDRPQVRGQDDQSSESRKREYLESRRRNVTLDDSTHGNKSTDKGMKYYEYSRGDDGERNGTRRLRRPALEDDLKLDKDHVKFLELEKDKSNRSSILFISSPKLKGNFSRKDELLIKSQIKKRNIKVKVD